MLRVQENIFSGLTVGTMSDGMVFATRGTRETESKIDSFANLENGWDYGKGGPIPEPVRDIAKAWNDYLRTQGVVRYTAAFPGSDSVTIAAGLLNDNYLEIITCFDGRVTYSVAHDHKGNQQFYEENLSNRDAVDLVLKVLRQALGETCTAYISYTPKNTTYGNIGSQGMHSGTTVGLYPWLEQTAFHLETKKSAPILGVVTLSFQELSVNPQYSGVLTPTSYPPKASSRKIQATKTRAIT